MFCYSFVCLHVCEVVVSETKPYVLPSVVHLPLFTPRIISFLYSQIHETVETINQLKTNREFFLSFTKDPQEFINNWLISQTRDLKVGCRVFTLRFADSICLRQCVTRFIVQGSVLQNIVTKQSG